MATVYRIAKWNETFETADSRRHKSLQWVSFPIDFNSSGYQAMVENFKDRAPSIYGAWTALVLLAATCPTRGTLISSRGVPLTLESIARQTFFPLSVFKDLFAWATSQSVGWIEVIDTTSRQPVVNQSSNDIQDLTNITNHTQQEDSSEVPETEPREPPVLVFPCNGRVREWGLLGSKVSEWQCLFPGLDVLRECELALQWCRDNPRKRKTHTGMLSFLSRWLSRENNKLDGRSKSAPVSFERAKIDRTMDVLRRARAAAGLGDADSILKIGSSDG